MVSMLRKSLKSSMLQIMLVRTFAVIALHFVSRIPFFTGSSVGLLAWESFDLPFQT
jgi:hypothetical protein